MKKAVIIVAIAALAASVGAFAAKGKTPAKTTTAAVKQVVPAGEIEINGDVAAPRTLKWSELSILPQQTVTVTIGGTSHVEQGPYLSDVLNLVTPNFVGCVKNDLLRWWILVSSKNGAATVLGRAQIDTGFGNRPAILSLSEDGKFLTTNGGPRLIVPGDGMATEDLQHVVMVTGGRAPEQLPVAGCSVATAKTITPSLGSLIINGAVTTPGTWSFSQLQGLNQATQQVSFLNGTTPVSNSETGPLLTDLLSRVQPAFKKSCPNDSMRWYLEFTGSDGYASILAYNEIDSSLGNRNPIVSLFENGVTQANGGPRILQTGDVKGGRAVSGSVAISVFRVAPRIPVAGC